VARADGAIRGCHALVDRLEAAGDHKAAEDVRAVLRSLAVSRATNRRLHGDAMALRRQIERMEREA
jgi:hypothetical protein